MNTLKEIKRNVRDVDAFVFDFDKTIVKGRAMELIGQELLRKDWSEHRYMKVVEEIKDGARIKAHMWRHRKEEDAEGECVRRFYDAVMKHTVLCRKEMEVLTLDYISQNTIAEVNEIVKCADKPKFLATLSGTTIAEMAAWHFKMTGFVSNIEQFDGKDALQSISIIMANGEQKLDKVERMLWQMGRIDIRRCAVVGDSATDIPLLSKAAVSIASPYAMPEVNRIAKLHVTMGDLTHFLN